MRSFINSIIAAKATCYFISPHFDDAAYSAGALISKLSRTNKVIIINVFTSPGPAKNGRWAKLFLTDCGYDNAGLLFRDRELEDSAALGPVSDRIINLGFTDAPWRQKTSWHYRVLARISPELSTIYPTLRLRFMPGNIARADYKNVEAVKNKLSEVVDTTNTVVFCPLALGKHIDHVVVRTVCDELFPDAIHWSDYPYNVENEIEDTDKHLEEIKLGLDFKRKEDLVKKYVSQYKAIIGDKQINQLEEYYYLPTKIRNTPNVQPAPRFIKTFSRRIVAER